MKGQTSPIPILSCALYRALHTLMCLEVHSLNRSLQDRTCSSRLFPNSGLTTHLMMARTGAQDVPEATELRGSNGKGGGGEAESWAARERCRLEAEGGAFPVGRERAWPGYKSGQERATAHALLRSQRGRHGRTDSRDLPSDFEPRITGCPKFPRPNSRFQVLRTFQVGARISS